MEYMTIKEASIKWDLSVRRIQTLCNEDKIDGAMRFGSVWAIPCDTERPADRRIKSGKYVKTVDELAGPILKWAGGKTQMLEDIQSRILHSDLFICDKDI